MKIGLIKCTISEIKYNQSVTLLSMQQRHIYFPCLFVLVDFMQSDAKKCNTMRYQVVLVLTKREQSLSLEQATPNIREPAQKLWFRLDS